MPRVLCFTCLRSLFAQRNSVVSMARPAGITMKAGPGSTIRAMPKSSTVNPIVIIITLFACLRVCMKMRPSTDGSPWPDVRQRCGYAIRWLTRRGRKKKIRAYLGSRPALWGGYPGRAEGFFPRKPYFSVFIYLYDLDKHLVAFLQDVPYGLDPLVGKMRYVDKPVHARQYLDKSAEVRDAPYLAHVELAYLGVLGKALDHLYGLLSGRVVVGGDIDLAVVLYVYLYACLEDYVLYVLSSRP